MMVRNLGQDKDEKLILIGSWGLVIWQSKIFAKSELKFKMTVNRLIPTLRQDNWQAKMSKQLILIFIYLSRATNCQGSLFTRRNGSWNDQALWYHTSVFGTLEKLSRWAEFLPNGSWLFFDARPFIISTMFF